MSSSVAAGIIAGIVLLLVFSIWSANRTASTAATGAEKSVVVIIPKDSSMLNNNFEPSVIKVVVGYNNTVVWINQDVVPHSVISDNGYTDPINGKFDSTLDENHPFIGPNKQFAFTFTEKGEYHYHSEPHPWMRGTVIVMSQGSATN
ncbi:MAG: hypothetical protein DA330_04190 [Nitrososphaera sp.]|nr:hypothetical protein [Nitrososphaera sp.]